MIALSVHMKIITYIPNNIINKYSLSVYIFDSVIKNDQIYIIYSIIIFNY